MQVKKIAITITLAFLSILVMGCDQIMGGSLVEITKILPDDVTTIWTVNVESLEANYDLEDLYDDFRYKIDEEGMEDALGIYLSDIRVIAYAESDDGIWLIIKGEMDFDDIRYALEDQNWEEDEYRDIETWVEPYDDSALAFLGDMVILSEELNDVKTSIRLSQDRGTPMYNNEDIKSIIDRLPTGIVSLVTRERVTDSSASGITLNRLALVDDALEIRGWYKFSSEKRAETSLHDLENYLDRQLDAIEIDCIQEDDFIEVIGEVDIYDFIESYFWSSFNLW